MQRTHHGWELFRPADGRPVLRVRWEWLARLVTRAVPRLDYARPGQGWAR